MNLDEIEKDAEKLKSVLKGLENDIRAKRDEAIASLDTPMKRVKLFFVIQMLVNLVFVIQLWRLP